MDQWACILESLNAVKFKVSSTAKTAVTAPGRFNIFQQSEVKESS